MKVDIIDLFNTLNKALYVVSPGIGRHQEKVAYVVYRLSRQLGWKQELCNSMFLAGLVHDIGALSLQEKNDIVFSRSTEDINLHAYRGAWLLDKFNHSREVADIVKYHHFPWNHGESLKTREGYGEYSNLLHLADRISSYIEYGRCVLLQVDEVSSAIEADSGTEFKPEFVDAFKSLAVSESFWLDVNSEEVLKHVDSSYFAHTEMSYSDFVDFAKILSYVIDFRSPFTATHSARVAESARSLAELLNFSSDDVNKMLIAGYLHDLGKITVDNAILEKKGALTKEEYAVIRSHTYYTYHLLEQVDGIDDIRNWASYHHERLDGSGYPFRKNADNLDLGARIMCVADVFAALKEPRPYKDAMDKAQIASIMNDMVDNRVLDGKIVKAMLDEYDAVSDACMEAGALAEMRYKELYSIV